MIPKTQSIKRWISLEYHKIASFFQFLRLDSMIPIKSKLKNSASVLRLPLATNRNKFYYCNKIQKTRLWCKYMDNLSYFKRKSRIRTCYPQAAKAEAVRHEPILKQTFSLKEIKEVPRWKNMKITIRKTFTQKNSLTSMT